MIAMVWSREEKGSELCGVEVARDGTTGNEKGRSKIRWMDEVMEDMEAKRGRWEDTEEERASRDPE